MTFLKLAAVISLFFFTSCKAGTALKGYEYTSDRAEIVFELLTLNMIKNICRSSSANVNCAGPSDGADELLALWFFGQMQPNESIPYLKKMSILKFDGESAHEYSLIVTRSGEVDARYSSGFSEYRDECVNNATKFLQLLDISHIEIERVCKD
jgi:hypothetical protein